MSARYDEALETYTRLETYGLDHELPSMRLSGLMAKATLYSTYTDMHDSELSEKLLIQALEISREIGDRASQAKLSWNLMLSYLFSKRLDEALQHGETALALAREVNEPESLAFVLNDLCRLYTCRGEFEKAHVVIREARELWRSLGNQVMLVDNLGSEGEAYINAGEFEKALEVLNEALPVSDKIENLWGQSYIRMLIAFAHVESGQLGSAIQFAGAGVTFGAKAGLIASHSINSELAWMYAYCGAFETGFTLIEQTLQDVEEKQPDWISFPRAAKVRMHLLQGDLQSAEGTAGNVPLQPITIPYARFTIFVCLANIELAVAKGEYEYALTLSNELLDEVIPLTRVDVPEALRWKGITLIGLDRYDEAHQVLTEACSLADEMCANLQLWLILANLAELNEVLGKPEEARKNRGKARKIVEGIAQSLHEIGLRDSFLEQPQVRKLMR